MSDLQVSYTSGMEAQPQVPMTGTASIQTNSFSRAAGEVRNEASNAVYVIDTNIIVSFYRGRGPKGRENRERFNKDRARYENVMRKYSEDILDSCVITPSVHREMRLLERGGKIEGGISGMFQPYYLPPKYRMTMEPDVRGLVKGIAKSIFQRDRKKYSNNFNFKETLSDADAELISYSFILQKMMKEKEVKLCSEDNLVNDTYAMLTKFAATAYSECLKKSFEIETEVDRNAAADSFSKYING